MVKLHVAVTNMQCYLSCVVAVYIVCRDVISLCVCVCLCSLPVTNC